MRVPLRTWFLAMFIVARHKRGISALQFQRDAGLGSYNTAWVLRRSPARRVDKRLSLHGQSSGLGCSRESP